MTNDNFLQNPIIQDLTLLTAQDVAKVLKVSGVKAYQLMQRNQIRTVKFGKCVRVRPVDLNAFIQDSIAN